MKICAVGPWCLGLSRNVVVSYKIMCNKMTLHNIKFKNDPGHHTALNIAA